MIHLLHSEYVHENELTQQQKGNSRGGEPSTQRGGCRPAKQTLNAHKAQPNSTPTSANFCPRRGPGSQPTSSPRHASTHTMAQTQAPLRREGEQRRALGAQNAQQAACLQIRRRRCPIALCATREGRTRFLPTRHGWPLHVQPLAWAFWVALQGARVRVGQAAFQSATAFASLPHGSSHLARAGHRQCAQKVRRPLMNTGPPSQVKRDVVLAMMSRERTHCSETCRCVNVSSE